MIEDSRISQPTLKPRRIRVTDILLVVIFVAICGVLIRTMWSQMSLKHEVTSAQVVSDKVVEDIAKQDASAAHDLGSADFKTHHPASQLTGLFQNAQPYIKGTRSVDKRTISNQSHNQTVYVVYRYGGSKPYFIRIAVTKPAGEPAWQLNGISGNPDESQLTNN